MSEASKQRRWRLFFVKDDFIVAWIRQGLDMPDVHYVPITDLPSDTKILESAYDHDRRGYLIRVEHDSFDPVPDGDETPYWGVLRWSIVKKPTHTLIGQLDIRPGESVKISMTDTEIVVTRDVLVDGDTHWSTSKISRKANWESAVDLVSEANKREAAIVREAIAENIVAPQSIEPF